MTLPTGAEMFLETSYELLNLIFQRKLSCSVNEAADASSLTDESE